MGRNWLDAGDERIEKNIVQVCFCEGVMLYAEKLETTLSTKGLHSSLIVLQGSCCGIMYTRQGRWVYAMMM